MSQQKQTIQMLEEKCENIFAQAEMMQALCIELGYTQSMLAKHLHLSQSSVGNKIRLLQFSSQERDRILYYRLSERHARALLRILPPKREKLIETVGQMQLNVQQTEELVEKYRSGAYSDVTVTSSDPQATSVENFSDYISTATNRLRNLGYHVSYLSESGDRWTRFTIIVRE